MLCNISDNLEMLFLLCICLLCSKVHSNTVEMTTYEFIVTTLEPFTETFSDILSDENHTEATYFYTEANITDTNGTQTIIKNKTMFKLYDVLVPLIGILVIITNGIVAASSGLILKRGVQPKTTYLFLGNIAMADLVTGLTTVGAEIYPKELRGTTTCIITLGLIVSTTLTSVMSVGLIGIDRFLYIVHGLRYQQWLTTYRARWLIAGSWFVCLIVGFLPGMGWMGESYKTRCWFVLLAPPELIMLTVAVGILPMILIVVLYSIILYHAIRKVIQLRRADTEASKGHAATGKNNERQQMRIFRGGTSKANQEANKPTSPKKTKAILIVALTAGSFVITWLPFFIACQIYALCVIKHGSTASCTHVGYPTATILPVLGFFNSLLNPIIYAWWHKGFRGFICNKLRKKVKHSSTTKSNSSGKTSSTCAGSSKGSKRSYTMSQKSSSSQNSESALQRLEEVELQPAQEQVAGATLEELSKKKTSVRLIEGPFIRDNEDTHL